MDFELSEDHRQLRDAVIEFASRELKGDVVKRDDDAEFPREGWLRCAEFGIQGMLVPPDFGGGGSDPLAIMVAMEALGYACTDNGLIFSINAQMWACEVPLVRAGTEEQKRRYLPGLCDGSIIAAHGMSEPGSGSDVFAMASTARSSGDGFVLNGSKTFVTNGPIADLFVVFASTGEGGGFGDITAFLLDRDTPGLFVGRPLHKMGLRTSPMCEIFFDGCEVPAGQVLGRPGSGSALFNSAMQWERSCILASSVGSMQRQLERSIEYARERRQFGRPIGGFQAVSHRIVDMKVRVDTARLLLYDLGNKMTQRKPVLLESAIVKLYLSECFVQSSLDALQIHGGYGYMTEYELERDVRDAIGGRIYSGTSDIQRNIAARLLGL